jgi:hypothetical protein
MFAAILAVALGFAAEHAETDALRTATVAVQRQVYDVTQHGVTADGTTDDTAAWQTLIDSTPDGSAYYLPTGVSKVSSIDFSGKKCWTLTGNGSRNKTIGSVLAGDSAGPVIRYLPAGSNTFSLRDIHISNKRKTEGSCFDLSNVVAGNVDRCVFTGHSGLRALADVFTLNIRGCKFSGLGRDTGIGILTTSHTAIDGCDITAWGEGLRASGVMIAVQHCRLEMNGVALRLGVKPDGGKWLLNVGDFAGLSMEGNGIGILTEHVASASFRSIRIQGTNFVDDAIDSQLGIDNRSGRRCDWRCVSVEGSFRAAAILFSGPNALAHQEAWSNVKATNAAVDAAGNPLPRWIVPATFTDVIFSQCDN